MREARESLRAEAVSRDIKATLERPEARRIFGMLLKFGGRDAPTLDLGPNGYATTAFNEGKRAMARMIAESVRMIDPRLLAECETAFAEFERAYGGIEEEEEE
jgi:hypothetical protein